MVARISIRTAAELVAAVPTLLGFIPTESLVMVALDGERILFTARHDLTAITNGHDAAMLAEVIASNNATSVLLVGISAEPSTEAQDEMVGHLAGYAIDVHRQIHVTTVAHAAEYIDYATGETGIAGDYRSSTEGTGTAATTARCNSRSTGLFIPTTLTGPRRRPPDPTPAWRPPTGFARRRCR